MEVVVETEYQDIYRITNGVLLIINKFRYIDYSSKTDEYIRLYNYKSNLYNKNCQKQIRVLKEDCHIYDITIPKGTVTYYDFPVELLSDSGKYEYKIKTTGNMFSGNNESMLKMLNDIIDKIKK